MQCSYLLISFLLSSPDTVNMQALEISNLDIYSEKKVSNCEKLYLPAEIAHYNLSYMHSFIHSMSSSCTDVVCNNGMTTNLPRNGNLTYLLTLSPKTVVFSSSERSLTIKIPKSPESIG